MNNKKVGTMEISFNIEMNEEINEYIRRMAAEIKSQEDVMNNRIIQQFREHIAIEGEIPQKVYEQTLSLFTVGYELGWNDHYALSKEDNK